jgi:poly(A) polymerase
MTGISAKTALMPVEMILSAGYSAYLHGYGAIDSLLGRGSFSGTCIQILTNAGTADLAKLFEDLRYPGMALADAALNFNDTTIYFSCSDFTEVNNYSIDDNRPSVNDNRPFINYDNSSFSLLEFYQDLKSQAFFDPRGLYRILTGIRQGFNSPQKEQKIKLNPLEILREGLNHNCERYRALMDAALILAKYFPPGISSESFQENEAEEQINEIADLLCNLREGAAPGQEEQRFLLSALVTSVNPALGFELLKVSGFIAEHWQELSELDEADHAKEFHPEGNAWKHTMETFRYRKTSSRSRETASSKRDACVCNLRLSLGLLLHDTGKPIATSSNGRRFEGHSELGEIQARRFLGRLGFSTSLINDVCFLVRNHMITAALPRLPLFRTSDIMSSPLFPALLELYRCDESSSFKGLDGYYESSAAYQAFLRNRKNPYRAADGKKIKNKHHLHLSGY